MSTIEKDVTAPLSLLEEVRRREQELDELKAGFATASRRSRSSARLAGSGRAAGRSGTARRIRTAGACGRTRGPQG